MVTLRRTSRTGSTSPGRAELDCGYLHSGNTSTLRFIKIIATSGGSTRNTALQPLDDERPRLIASSSG